MTCALRTAAALLATVLALGLGGCGQPTATVTTSTLPPTTVGPPAVAPVSTTVSKPPATKATRSRHSTSGEEQFKAACEAGEIAKSECDAFFADARREGVIFNA